jgi:hypothetical protein
VVTLKVLVGVRERGPTVVGPVMFREVSRPKYGVPVLSWPSTATSLPGPRGTERPLKLVEVALTCPLAEKAIPVVRAGVNAPLTLAVALA